MASQPLLTYPTPRNTAFFLGFINPWLIRPAIKHLYFWGLYVGPRLTPAMTCHSSASLFPQGPWRGAMHSTCEIYGTAMSSCFLRLKFHQNGVLRRSVWQDIFSRLNRNPKWCRLRYFERNLQNTPPRKTWRNGPVRITLKTSWTFQIWFCLSCFVFFVSHDSHDFICFSWKQPKSSLVENQEKHRGEAYKYWIWTRLDWHWLAPPPSLDIFLEANPRAVWIPDGSDWDGINDSPLVSWFHTSWWTKFWTTFEM